MGNAGLADVFISYTGRDRGWATWLDFILREARYIARHLEHHRAAQPLFHRPRPGPGRVAPGPDRGTDTMMSANSPTMSGIPVATAAGSRLLTCEALESCQ